MLKNKYTRFFIVETPFKRRLIIFGALVVLVLLESLYLRYQSHRLNDVRAQKDLVEKIPRMQAMLAEGKAPEKRIVQVAHVLQGLTEQNGAYMALINDGIYFVGDKIDDYVVTSLERNTAVLTHQKTHAQEILTLYADEDQMSQQQSEMVETP